MRQRIRMAVVVLLVAGLVVAGYVGYRLFTEQPRHEPPTSRVTGTTDDGWQQITYRGLDLEVPPEWQRLSSTACDFVTVEHWGSPDQDPCSGDTGLSFLDSRSFDPATGPGVHTVPTSDSLPDGGWSGYVTRGDVVVDVTDGDEAVVRRILKSVSQTL